MLTVLEGTTVKARNRHTRTIAGLLVGAVASGAFATLGAQNQVARPGQTPGPRFMVPTFRSNERGLGLQAAEALRERMGQDFKITTLWIVPKSDVMNTLTQSGYSTTEALNPNDARALAVLLRASEYVEGTITKNPTGTYTVDANMMLVRPDGMVQPLPKVEVGKLGDAARQISNAVENARKQIAPTEKCIEHWRAKNFAAAIAEARKGIAAYPSAVFPRVCMAEVYAEQKLGADSMIAISEAILAIHKDNRRALAFAADAYAEKQNEDKQVEMLTRLLAADPTNTRRQAQIVEILAGSGKARLALPIIDEAVKNNPGDPQLVRLQWLVHLAAKDIKGAVTVGEEMVRLDTAAADTTFFIRQAAAYAQDSQPQKASETVSKGVSKFGDNTTLSLLQIQFFRQAGQTQQAIEAAKKLAAAQPKTPGLWLQIAQAQVDLQMPPDSVLASLRNALAAGDSAGMVAPYATSVGQSEMKKATANKDIEGFRRAITILTFADSVQQSPTSAFLLGATHVSKGQALLIEARDKKSCEMSREAADDFTQAQIYIPRGAQGFREEAGRLMGALQQLSPYGDQMVKALCRGR